MHPPIKVNQTHERRMPKKLQKRLQDYLTKVRKPPPSIQFPSKKWMRACKHPKTQSLAVNNNGTPDKDDDAATLSDIDEFLFENFRSLYLKDDQGDTTDDYESREEKDLHRPPRDAFRDKTLQMKEDYLGDHENESTNEPFWDKRALRLKKRRPDHQETQNQDGFLFESPRLNIDPPAADLCGSHRFSVSPGRLLSSVRTSTTATTISEDAGSSSMSARTLSLNESATTSHSNNYDHSPQNVALPSDCISVLMYSPNPGYEFKRSMHDMVEARLRNKAQVDWNFMEELLFCYLNLNEKKSHKFILRAFADLVVDMRQDSDVVAPGRGDHGDFEIPGEGPWISAKNMKNSGGRNVRLNLLI